MALLKENSCLDIEYINNLPLNEWAKVIQNLTKKQFNEYFSNQPINENKECPRYILINYSMEEEKGVDALQFLNKMKNKYGVK
jgi:hypothetical protein